MSATGYLLAGLLLSYLWVATLLLIVWRDVRRLEKLQAETRIPVVRRKPVSSGRSRLKVSPLTNGSSDLLGNNDTNQ